MALVNLWPGGVKKQFVGTDGLPLVGYWLFFFVGGSVNTKAVTYTTSAGNVANPNPIQLNALGEMPDEAYFVAGQTYKAFLEPPDPANPSVPIDPPTSGQTLGDFLPGINDVTATQSEWQAGPDATFINGTSFTVLGDQTSTFTPPSTAFGGRRVRLADASVTKYATISDASYNGSSLTTVTVVNDGAALIGPISAVAVGLLAAANPSIPSGTSVGAEQDIASAATTNIGQKGTENVRITGTTPITSFGVAPAGTKRTFRMAGILTITYNATSLITFSGANIITSVNGVGVAISLGSGNWYVASYAGAVNDAGAVRVINGGMILAAANATATFTAVESIMETAIAGVSQKYGALSQALNLATVGAGGMDIGAAPVSGNVSVFEIGKTDGTKSVMAVGKTYTATTTNTNNTLTLIASTAGSYPGDVVTGVGIPVGTTIISLTPTSIVMSANATASAAVTINTYPPGPVYAGTNFPNGYTLSAYLGTLPLNGSSQFLPGQLQGQSFYRQAAVAIFTATASATSLTTRDVSAGVPGNAKTVDIVMSGTVTSAGHGFTVAADGTGIGVDAKWGTSFGATFTVPAGIGARSIAMTFKGVPIATVQTIFWQEAVGVNNISMHVTGYST